jgi:hypothetical protein
MKGLLDFIQSPEGIGLLSAAAGGLATARRGTPLNNIGRGAVAGLTGYSQAKDDIYQKDQLAKANELRDIQIAEAKRIQGLNSQLGGLFDKYKIPGTPETPERTVFNDPSAIEAFNNRPVSTPAINNLPFSLSQDQPAQQQRDFSTTTIPGVPAKPAGINFDALNQEAEPLLAQLDPANYFKTKAEEARKSKELIKAGKDDRFFQPGTLKEVISAAPEKIDYNKPFLPDGTPNEAYQEYSHKNRAYGANRQSVILPAVEKSARIETNSDFVKHVYRPVLDTSKKNVELIGQLDAFEKLPIAEKTGWGTKAKATAYNVLTTLGLADKEATAYASNAQSFNSVVNRQIFTLLGQQKGPQTEGDAQRARDTFASLDNTPEANKFIVDFTKAVANKQNSEANHYRKNYSKALAAGDLSELERTYLDSDEGQKSIWQDPVLQKWNKTGTAQPQANGLSPAGAAAYEKYKPKGR